MALADEGLCIGEVCIQTRASPEEGIILGKYEIKNQYLPVRQEAEQNLLRCEMYLRISSSKVQNTNIFLN